ncbi:MAG TPA: hypothetical protein DCE11_05125 [Ruminiclostridium sp.]|jgi:hypothetical protein|nr:hypothetical protein [Ruminiclostridium sp.]
MNSVFAIYKIKSCKKNIDYYCIIVYNSKNLFLPKEAILSKALMLMDFMHANIRLIKILRRHKNAKR